MHVLCDCLERPTVHPCGKWGLWCERNQVFGEIYNLFGKAGGKRKRREMRIEKICSPFTCMVIMIEIKRKKPFLLSLHICNLPKLGGIEGREWFLNNRTHIHNIIWYEVTYLSITFMHLLHLYGYKSKKKHIFSFHFLSHCNPNKGKKNALFSFLFSFSPYFQTYTRQLISFLFFSFLFFLLFISFVLSPLFSLVFWKIFLFLTLANANNTPFPTPKSRIFMCQLLFEF